MLEGRGMNLIYTNIESLDNGIVFDYNNNHGKEES